MEEAKQKRKNFYDTGGTGTKPSSRGEAYRWWVPSQYTSIPRLMMATRLAIGPASIEDLRDLSGGSYCGVYQIVRNWVGRRFAAWTICRVKGRQSGERFGVVTLAADGRRDLWRFAQVTSRLRFSEAWEFPLRSDVPDEPLEALRLYARHEFLRPSSMALVEELIGWPGQNALEIARHTGCLGTTDRGIKRLRAAGFLTDITGCRVQRGCITMPKWVLNETGHDALDRHIDALRRAAIVSGYTPERSCEYYYPNQRTSFCASTMNEYTPPPCPDCLWYDEVILRQRLYRGEGLRVEG
ncbi:MAG TPA: hypothetical protein VGM51_12010 [Armatimonadota bacterium]|jgi:hypothetical protein